jgi:hypothetical protein
MTPDPTPQHGSAGFCTDHGQAPDERVETVARVLYDLDSDGCEPSDIVGWRREMAPVCDEYRRKAAAVVAALGDETARPGWVRVGDYEAACRNMARAEAERDAARAALDRGRAETLWEADLDALPEGESVVATIGGLWIKGEGANWHKPQRGGMTKVRSSEWLAKCSPTLIYRAALDPEEGR